MVLAYRTCTLSSLTSGHIIPGGASGRADAASLLHQQMEEQNKPELMDVNNARLKRRSRLRRRVARSELHSTRLLQLDNINDVYCST